jgi:CheY-like chemotaxis protein
MEQSLYEKVVVLYADDDPDDREMLRTAFLPYTLLELRTFIDGLDLLSYANWLAGKNIVPGLILLDINMPMLGAWQVLQRLRASPATKDVHVLFLTNFTLKKGEGASVYDDVTVITKPAGVAERDRMMKTIISHCPKNLQEKFRL